MKHSWFHSEPAAAAGDTPFMLNRLPALLGLTRLPLQTALIWAIAAWVIQAATAFWVISPGPKGAKAWPRVWSRTVPDHMPIYCDLGGHRGWAFASDLEYQGITRDSDGWYKLPQVSITEPAPTWLGLSDLGGGRLAPGFGEELYLVSSESRPKKEGQMIRSAEFMWPNGATLNTTQISEGLRVRPTGMWTMGDSYQILFGGIFMCIVFLVISTPVAITAGAIGYAFSDFVTYRRGSSS